MPPGLGHFSDSWKITSLFQQLRSDHLIAKQEGYSRTWPALLCAFHQTCTRRGFGLRFSVYPFRT
jgi:hypothetical protein